MSDTVVISELTLNDIAAKVCDHYHMLKRQRPFEKVKILFLEAITYYFNAWAKERDYSIREFKGQMGRIIQKKKKVGKITPSQEVEIDPEEIAIYNSLNQKKEINSIITDPIIQEYDFVYD